MAKKPKDRRTRAMLIAEGARMINTLGTMLQARRNLERESDALIGTLRDSLRTAEQRADELSLELRGNEKVEGELRRQIDDTERDLVRTRTVAVALVAMTGMDHSPRRLTKVLRNMLLKMDHTPATHDAIIRTIIARGYAAAVKHNLEPAAKDNGTHPLIEMFTKALDPMGRGRGPMDLLVNVLGLLDVPKDGDTDTPEGMAAGLERLSPDMRELLRQADCGEPDCQLHSYLRRQAATRPTGAR